MESRSVLNQVQSQSLFLTPELQQSLRLLQSGRAEIGEIIENELLENPVLEAVEEFREDEETKIERIERMRELWNASSCSATHFRDGGESFRAEELISNPLGSLSEHLLRQIREIDISSLEMLNASHVIGNLNNDGYLEIDCGELARSSGGSECDMEKALATVQSLEPVGVGARTLKECLILQLRARGLEQSLEERMLSTYTVEIEKGNLQQIAQSEHIELSVVHKAMVTLRQLDPYPGRHYPSQKAEYLIADVYVEKGGSQYVAVLNSTGTPELQLNRSYQKMSENKDALSSQERRFFQERVKTASWFIRCLSLRNQTLLRVANTIVERQQDFLAKGPESLKPLRLCDIANEVQLHESTVSRAIANKYIHTPFGIFPMKYFLSPRIKTVSGDVATSSIKERIRTIITNELHNAPISDQDIVRVLQRVNILIARRTVGKYREAMGIASAAIRKQSYEVSKYAA